MILETYLSELRAMVEDAKKDAGDVEGYLYYAGLDNALVLLEKTIAEGATNERRNL